MVGLWAYFLITWFWVQSVCGTLGKCLFLERLLSYCSLFPFQFAFQNCGAKMYSARMTKILMSGFSRWKKCVLLFPCLQMIVVNESHWHASSTLHFIFLKKSCLVMRNIYLLRNSWGLVTGRVSGHGKATLTNSIQPMKARKSRR